MSPYNYPASIGEGMAYAVWLRAKGWASIGLTFLTAWRDGKR